MNCCGTPAFFDKLKNRQGWAAGMPLGEGTARGDVVSKSDGTPAFFDKLKNRQGRRFLSSARDRSGNTGAAVPGGEELERIARFLRSKNAPKCSALFDKAAFFERLLERGILVRSCANYPSLEDGGYFRIAVKKPRENCALLAAVRAICSMHSMCSTCSITEGV